MGLSRAPVRQNEGTLIPVSGDSELQAGEFRSLEECVRLWVGGNPI